RCGADNGRGFVGVLRELLLSLGPSALGFPEHKLFADGFKVMAEICSRWRGVRQCREERQAAYAVELPLVPQSALKGDCVDSSASRVQFEHRLKNRAVPAVVKIFRGDLALKDWQDFGRTEHRATKQTQFGGKIVRWEFVHGLGLRFARAG